MGRRKAAVLPVPVWAVAITSRPARADGIGPGLDGGRLVVSELGGSPDEHGVKAQGLERHVGSGDRGSGQKGGIVCLEPIPRLDRAGPRQRFRPSGPFLG